MLTPALRRSAAAMSTLTLSVAGLVLATAPTAQAASFSSTTAISVPSPQSCTTQDKADVYPSTIAVSGLDPVISDVDVTVNFAANNQGNLAKLRLLVVSPSGAKTVLIHRASNSSVGTPSAGGSYTFDDEASGPLPTVEGTSPVQLPASASYQPTNAYNGTPSCNMASGTAFPSPAPGAITGSPSKTLAAIDGTNPNGDWKLFATSVDNNAGGLVAPIAISGWSLNVTAGPAQDFTTGPSVTVSGTAQVNKVLTANVTDPTPSTGVTYTYQWQRVDNGTTTNVGSNSKTYTAVSADREKTLRVVVTAAKLGYNSASATSSETGPVALGDPVPIGMTTINGTAQVGTALTCANPTAPVTFAWTNVTESAARAATASYTPTIDDLGDVLRCTVTRTVDGFAPGSSSADTAAVAPGTFTVEAPVITGSAAIGQTLSCATTTTGDTVSYSWTRTGSAAVIATTAAYTVKPVDGGKKLTCRASVARTGYSTANASTSTATVAPLKPVVKLSKATIARGGKVVISGDKLTPGAKYSIKIGSKVVKTGTVPASGKVSFTATIAKTAAKGTATVTVATTGPSASGTAKLKIT